MSENGLLLSIIIPFYNNGAHLTASLDSLFKQIEEDIEIVLINDGSTDNSLTVVSEFIAKNPHDHVRLISQKNAGVAHARNVGLENVRGRYVTFLDADDFLSQHYLRTLRPLLQSDEFDLIGFNYTKVADDAAVQDAHFSNVRSLSYDFKQRGLKCLTPLFTSSMWHLWSRVYRRSLLHNETFATGRRYEDVIFTPFIYFKTQKIIHVDHDLYFYRDNALGITRNIQVKDIDDLVFAMEKMLAFAARPEQDPDVKQLAALMIVNCFSEVKSMTKSIYGYYYYPKDLRQTLRKAASLCEDSAIARKKVWQMRYPQIDTVLSKVRLKTRTLLG